MICNSLQTSNSFTSLPSSLYLFHTNTYSCFSSNVIFWKAFLALSGMGAPPVALTPVFSLFKWLFLPLKCELLKSMTYVLWLFVSMSLAYKLGSLSKSRLFLCLNSFFPHSSLSFEFSITPKDFICLPYRMFVCQTGSWFDSPKTGNNVKRPPRGHLVMSGDTLGYHNTGKVCYSHLVGRGQGCS